MLQRNVGHLLCLSIVVLGLVSDAVGQRLPFLIERQGTWRYYASAEDPPPNWNALDFADDGWKQGQAGFGYADDDDKTVLNDMLNNYRSVYIRSTFMVKDPAAHETLYLYVNYDDGFIAYLNGKQIVAAQADRPEGKLTVGTHEATGYELFAIEKAKELLQPGKNVLAIEGHNRELESSDFSLDPFLVTERITSAGQLVAADDMRADLAEFERRLEDQSSYRTRRQFDYKRALQDLGASINDDTPAWEFALKLKKIVMQLGDCHADVLSPHIPPHIGMLPFRPALTRDGIAVLSLNRRALLDDETPYLESIDGVPLEKWQEAASRYVQQGSPQLIQYRSLDWLVRIELLRYEMGLPANPTATLTLRSADGAKRKEEVLRVSQQPSGMASIPFGATRILNDNIMYIRIPEMNDRLIESVVRTIQNAKDTRGMILDVRDNSGGTYALMNAIYGFFVPDGTPPYVTNIAAYRLSPQFMPDHLAYRPTYPDDWEGWSSEEREAIAKATESFQPEWLAPEGTMSRWHYMVLSRARGKQEYYHYDKPVVVLCNPGSFSATDGFLSAFADLPQVTLMGQASGGGSGATRRFVLERTGIYAALSSMASYRANGKTFDGHGVEVDVEALPVVTDYLGPTDSVVDQAVNHLSKQ